MQSESGMRSAIYSGWVRHRRKRPTQHAFRYKVFMVYFSLAELEKVLSLSPLWSTKAWSFARFKREDFHGDPQSELSDAVKRTVEKALGKRPGGDVRVLANLRYFGFNMNPLTTYYCFAEDGTTLQAIVAEVTNTPWNERRAYVIDCTHQPLKQNSLIDKDFTVSPFNPLNMTYRWRSNTPADHVHIHIDCLRDDTKVLDATLLLMRQEISARSLNRVLLTFPFMTVKVVASIYWQALRLFLKGVPFLGKDNPGVSDAEKHNKSKPTDTEKTHGAPFL